jgi:acyl-CoA synthetase (AMP-forming)/AMP-acid ligase II
VIELLRRAPGGHAAVVTDERTVTYGELAAAAERVAANLRRRGITRAAIVDPDAATVLALLGGMALAGVEGCQYPPVDEPEQVALLAERFDHQVLITPRTDLAAVAEVIEPSDLVDAPADPWTEGPPPARPLLVLTTGTTGAPRGVRHDWDRVLVGSDRARSGTGQRWLLAYGLHQFAGLQVLVHVMGAGATLVAPTPRRPIEGLAAMRRHGVDHASATPTYWRFLLAEMRSDGGPVPRLRQLTLGGEAIPGPLLAQLSETFPEANISQVYAASEFGSTGSMRDGRSGLSVDVLDRGDDADVDMKVVDGELWIRSRRGMLGYHGEPPVDPDGWRPTGDLVEIVDDRILFRGRSSEIINVGGVKVHPLPIEERICAIPGVDLARVYGRANALTGAIVAVEVVAAADADTDALDAAIRAACSDLPAAARPRSIRFVASFALAGNNKIVRRDTDVR